MAGFLPFSAIYIEISELFAAGNVCAVPLASFSSHSSQFGDSINPTHFMEF
jgi:hypothetical protein